MGGIQSYTGLEINEIKETMQPDSAQKTQERYRYLPRAHPDMPHIAKRRPKANGKGRMAQPAENYSIDYKKYRETLKIKGKIAEILHHGKARADERTIHNTIGDIIKFVT